MYRVQSIFSIQYSSKMGETLNKTALRPGKVETPIPLSFSIHFEIARVLREIINEFTSHSLSLSLSPFPPLSLSPFLSLSLFFSLSLSLSLSLGDGGISISSP